MLGETISHYTILEELGRGGMGVVYKAQDLKLDRIVALKFLPFSLSSSGPDKERFVREAKSTSALNHPNILTVHDIDESDGELFIASEFVEGRTVRHLLIDGGMSIAQTIDIAGQLADGLRHAHNRGIVHRDIKPENIMITADGLVKIMDFGLARANSPQNSLTTPGTFLGTLRYMSPEQVSGKAADHLSDIYSFGVTLYEMLAGRPPFEADYEVAVLYAILNSEPIPLDELNPSVPPRLVPLVMRCLEKSPSRRFQNFDDVLGELKSMPRGTPAADLDVPPSAGLGRSTVVPFVPRSGSRAGREREFGQLLSIITTVINGNGKAVLLKGESGIGKTTLVAAVAEEARKLGMHALWGRCLFHEPGLPYHPFAAALKGYFQSAGLHVLDSLARAASKQGLDAGGRLALIKGFLGLSPESPEVLNKEQLWDAIVFVLRMLTLERPIMLVIDDLQWADRITLGLFSYIARTLGESRVVLVGMYRPEPSPHERDLDISWLTDSVRQLKIDGLAEEIELHRLTRQETASVLSELTGVRTPSVEFIDKVFETTDGNPLFMVELVTLLKNRGMVLPDTAQNPGRALITSPALPERINDVILQRLSGLSAEERETLDVAACEGVYFRSDMLVACLRADRITMLKRLQALEKNHALIRNEKSRYRFDHPLIRQVLYEGMLVELREEYHRTIAAWMIDRHAGDPEMASSIAHHLIASAQEAEAVGFMFAAADRSRSLCAFDEALLDYRRIHAILEGTTPRPLAQLLHAEEGIGDCLQAAGAARNAAEHYDSMLLLARQLSHRAGEAAALRKMGDCLRVLGELPAAMQKCEAALAIVGASADPRARLECFNAISLIHIAKGDYTKAIEVLGETLVSARGLSDAQSTALSLCNLGMAHFHTGEYQAAVEDLEEARKMQEFTGDRRGLAATFNFLALVYNRLARYGEGLRAGFAALEIKENIRDVVAIPGSLNILGDIYRDAGNPAKASEYHARSLAMAREHGNRGSECDNIRDLGVDRMLLGEMDRAKEHLDEVLRLSREFGYSWYETRSCISLGEFHLKRKETERAKEFSARGLDLARSLNARELVMEALWKRGLVFCQEGSGEQGIALFLEAIHMAEQSGHGIFLWQIYRDLADAYARGGKSEESHRAALVARRLADSIAAHIDDQDLQQSFLALKAIRELPAASTEP